MATLSTAGAERVALRRLQTLASNLPALDLTEEVDQAARLLQAQLPTLPDYEQLAPEYQAFYDLATGLRAAVNLLAPAIMRATRGYAKIKEGDEEYTFLIPSLTEREVWAEEISQAIGHLVQFVQSLEPPRCRPRFSMFGAAGVARTRARREYSLSGLMRLYVPGQWYYDGAFSIAGQDDGSILTGDALPGDFPGDNLLCDAP